MIEKSQNETDDESDIRALIERWAHAVHAGDLDVVLADHAKDIVKSTFLHPTTASAGLRRTGRRGHHSSSGNDKEPCSRSSHSKSLRSMMSRSLTPWSAAGPATNWSRILTIVCGSPSGCESRQADGS